jgi:AcrR family transcriptional regulator
LIVRERVFETALELIGRDGFEHFSMRALARALGVSAASLYHHFRDKDEILEGAAALALDVSRRPPAPSAAPPEDQIVAVVVDALRALQRHPEVIPVLVRRADREFAVVVHGHMAELLVRSGVPAPMVVPWLDILEGLLIGAAVLDVHTTIEYDADAVSYPILHESLEATDPDLDAADRLEIAVRALLIRVDELSDAISRA